MRLGVRQKLVLLSLLILVVVSFTFTAVQLDLTRTWREEDLRDRAVIFAREMAATIGDRHELESGALIDRKIHQIMAVRPSVLQLDIVRLPPGGGAVVATSEPAHRLPFTPADEVAVRGGAVLSRLLTDAGGRSWEVMAPIRLDGAVAGAVAARFSLNRFDAREARSRTVAFWLTAISVLVMGLLMTLAVHGVVNRPIERFVRAMRGAEAEPVAVTSNDEFGALARRFNDMIARARERLFAMQRDLSHAERLALSGRIVAEVAHEIGTPLHSVMGHLELLREDLPPLAVSETIERRLRVIESQLGRLREIIDRLLDLTRRSPQPAVPVDVNGLVQETVELVRPAVAAARLELSVEADPGVPRLLAQRSELQQVVLNLLTNALDATPPGGAIRVATRARGQRRQRGDRAGRARGLRRGAGRSAHAGARRARRPRAPGRPRAGAGRAHPHGIRRDGHGDRGDPPRRVRLPEQAVPPRRHQARGAPHAGGPAAGPRQPALSPRAARALRPGPPRRPLAGDRRHLQAGGARGGPRHHRADPGRDGHGQGAGGARNPLRGAARRPPVRRHRLRGDPRAAVRVRAVRPRAWRLHGRGRHAPGPAGDRAGRHLFSRRDLRAVGSATGQAAARAAGPRAPARGRERPHPRRRAARGRHQPGSEEARRGRPVPRGSLLPPQRRHRRRAGAPRAPRRRGAAGRALRAQVRDGGGQARGGLRAGHAGCPSRLRVAGQRARAGARRRARGRAGALDAAAA